jgi:hypothetical protein
LLCSHQNRERVAVGFLAQMLTTTFRKAKNHAR